MAGTFDTEYGLTPWPVLDQNTHDIWVPDLLEMFINTALFYGMVDYTIDLGALRTQRVIFTQRMRGPANIAPLAARQLWLPQYYFDSRALEITCTQYGDKIMLHKTDDRMTQWKQGNALGLQAIVREDLGPHMIETLDKLALLAFLSTPFYAFCGDATGFSDLAKADVFDIGPTFRGVQLRSRSDRELQGAKPICYMSPGGIYGIRNAATTTEWHERIEMARPEELLAYTVGAYESVPVNESMSLTLLNVGAIIAQTTIDAKVTLGDGAPDPRVSGDRVDGVWMVGQEGVTHSISVASASGLAVGDIVTLHRTRNNADAYNRTLNGVPYDGTKNLDMRIVKVSGTNISFAEPVMVDWYEEEVSSGIYGWLTLARPVHAALFILGPRGVVAGVVQPPATYEPNPVDDTNSIWRMSWDAYLKYQLMFSKRVFVKFYAAPIVNGNNEVVEL